ncbi:MAG: hypothetical protein SNF33_05390 [Candidatus Algichlamydia australiensis]|nr:hypothetical protein [Chlamydiales bacterium]
MKKMLYVATLALSSMLCAAKPEVISIEDINPEMMAKLQEKERAKLIVKMPKGMELPMSVLIYGDFFSAGTGGEEAFTVTIKQDLFLKFCGDVFFASLDGKNWKKMEEFFTGSFGWSVNDETATKFGLYLEANLRK